ncbi:hypothetical protein AB1L42_15540 [Thalassoglobus sp. JC818]|uniref:hypothetical protein n=1 Tax=Thalassoglobus sp. JC818 TaxID=3232136 RepID=UPI00345A17BA
MSPSSVALKEPPHCSCLAYVNYNVPALAGSRQPFPEQRFRRTNENRAADF